MSKPRSRKGYSAEQTQRVRATCLYLATKIGDRLDDVAVMRGLAPSLIVPQDEGPHAGTADLDLGLSIALFNEKRYAELAKRLAGAGFEPDFSARGDLTRH